MTSASKRHGFAWLGLAAALGLHVIDEAAHDFLSVYNPTVLAIRERAGWLPLPTFTFRDWLAGLILAVAVLAVLTFWVFRGARWLRVVSYPLGVLMVLNGVGHMAASLYQGRAMPGVLSSPVLIIAAVFLLRAARLASGAPSLGQN